MPVCEKGERKIEREREREREREETKHPLVFVCLTVMSYQLKMMPEPETTNIFQTISYATR